MTNIARKTETATQNMQHFISASPWEGRDLIKSIREAIMFRGEYQEESILILDESADKKAGKHSAGAGRQHNGRLGKVDMSQVGVFLSLTNQGYQTWVDGELYLPKHWFEKDHEKHRQQAGIPKERHFQTKLQLGLEMIKRAKAEELPFVAVDFDTLYGRKGGLRDEIDGEGIEYYADVPSNTKVYLNKPTVFWAESKAGKKFKKPRVSSPRYRYEVKDLLKHPQTYWSTLTLRPNERGFLKADFSRCRIWTVRDDGSVREEWLLIRRDAKRITYSLSNAPLNASLLLMTQRKSQRYFIERSNQDAKSELGWDEFQAIKYRAWQHHLALTIAASWFITETRLDWNHEFQRDPALLEQYELDVLPALSMSNVRELLRATLPLPQLSPLEATALVIEHLDNRSRSRKSRLRHALSP